MRAWAFADWKNINRTCANKITCLIMTWVSICFTMTILFVFVTILDSCSTVLLISWLVNNLL